MKAEETHRRWLVVLGSMIALVIGNGSIILFTFGVFLKPISTSFGWPRSTLATALVLSHAAGAIAMPFVGSLVDRHGVRRIALPAIAAFAAILAIGGWLASTPLQFLLFYTLLGLVGAGHSTLTYARLVATWFDARRGLALGITLSGVGVGAAIVPKFTQFLIGSAGWREAYVGLAVLLAIVGLPVVGLMLRERSREEVTENRIAVEGLTLRGAVATRQFWIIVLAMLPIAAAINGCIAHVVPILTDRGVPVNAATSALAASGLSLIFGRILSGLALDRYHAPLVAVVFFLLPLAGMVILGVGANGRGALFAAVLLGIGVGAEVDIMAYLTSRYFGMAHYGAIYGWMLAVFTLGTGVGPWLLAHAFDYFGDYSAALVVAGGLLVAGMLMIGQLGPYRYSADRQEGTQ